MKSKKTNRKGEKKRGGRWVAGLDGWMDGSGEVCPPEQGDIYRGFLTVAWSLLSPWIETVWFLSRYLSSPLEPRPVQSPSTPNKNSDIDPTISLSAVMFANAEMEREKSFLCYFWRIKARTHPPLILYLKRGENSVLATVCDGVTEREKRISKISSLGLMQVCTSQSDPFVFFCVCSSRQKEYNRVAGSGRTVHTLKCAYFVSFWSPFSYLIKMIEFKREPSSLHRRFNRVLRLVLRCAKGKSCVGFSDALELKGKWLYVLFPIWWNWWIPTHSSPLSFVSVRLWIKVFWYPVRNSASPYFEGPD